MYTSATFVDHELLDLYCVHYMVPSFRGLDSAYCLTHFILFDLLDKSNMSVMIAL